MMYGWQDGWGWGMMAVGVVFWLVVVGAVVYGIAYAVRQNSRQHTPDTGGVPPSRARDILEERFARGEIDEKEFRERSDALRQ